MADFLSLEDLRPRLSQKWIWYWAPYGTLTPETESVDICEDNTDAPHHPAISPWKIFGETQTEPTIVNDTTFDFHNDVMAPDVVISPKLLTAVTFHNDSAVLVQETISEHLSGPVMKPIDIAGIRRSSRRVDVVRGHTQIASIEPGVVSRSLTVYFRPIASPSGTSL